MDIGSVTTLLSNTLNPDTQKDAEKQLDELDKTAGFSTALLQVCVAGDDVPSHIKQASAVHLKNLIVKYWPERDPIGTVGFVLCEDDLVNVRNNIVNAVIYTTPLIRKQMSAALHIVLRRDFAEISGIMTNIFSTLDTEDPNVFLGSLCSLHQLLKVFEYKNRAERKVLVQPMKHYLPIFYTRAMAVIGEVNEEVATQIILMVLKCVFTYISFLLETSVVTFELFSRYMELVQACCARECSAATNALERDDAQRADSVDWKVKKRSLQLMLRTFDRYGTPGHVDKQYKSFASQYLKSFTGENLRTIFALLQKHQSGEYVSDKVLKLCFQYINSALSQSFSWKLLKPHFGQLFETVMLPILCFSKQDLEMYESDPVELIRMKAVITEVSTVQYAVKQLVITSANKRKDVLNQMMAFCIRELSTNVNNLDDSRRDGIYHVISTVSAVLLEKATFKKRLEEMLVSYVFPFFTSPTPFIRARCAELIGDFEKLRYKNSDNHRLAVTFVRDSLLHESDLLVRYHSAVALSYICDGEGIKQLLTPCLREIIVAYLQVIQETQLEESADAMQMLIGFFEEEITPHAQDIIAGLVQAFMELASDPMISENSDKCMSGVSMLTTIQNVLAACEDKKELILSLETLLLPLIAIVFEKRLDDFFEEVFAMIEELTHVAVSPQMWQVYEHVCNMIINDALPARSSTNSDIPGTCNIDHFEDMMPCLHNFICVDSNAFSSNDRHMELLFNAIKIVLHSGLDETAETHAAKLIEVVILQFRGRIDSVIPLFIDTTLERLNGEEMFADLRSMLMQVLAAAIYYNPTLTFDYFRSRPDIQFGKFTIETAAGNELRSVLDSLKSKDKGGKTTSTKPNATWHLTKEELLTLTPLCRFFVNYLKLCDDFVGLHDRRMAIYTLTTLLRQDEVRQGLPPAVLQRVTPSLLHVFDGLKKAYVAQKEADIEDSDDEEDEEMMDNSDDDIAEIHPSHHDKTIKSRRSRPGADQTELDSDEDDVAHENTAVALGMKNGGDDDEVMTSSKRGGGNRRGGAAGGGDADGEAIDIDTEGDEDDDDDDYDYIQDDFAETDLEMFETYLDKSDCEDDEYVGFKDMWLNISQQDTSLCAQMTVDQQKEIQDILETADEKKRALTSRVLNKSGGFNFTQVDVPSAFKFGANNGHS